MERRIGNRCENLSKTVVGMAPGNREVLLSKFSLEDLSAGYGPYYSFLLPMFEEIRHRTGQEIDCYAHARFRDSGLQVLHSTIAQQLSDVQGTTELNVIDEGQSEKIRTEFLRDLLTDMLKIVQGARERGAEIRFEGD